MSDWIDISVPLFNGMVGWPGDPPYHAEFASDMKRGDDYNLTRIATSVHIGTHMDAPLHFVDGAATIDQAPLDALIGPARVIRIDDQHAVTAAEVERAAVQPGERILFRTRNSNHAWVDREFDKQFVAISPEAAELLAQIRPVFIGIDYLSIGSFDNGGPPHRSILGAGIWVVEGLDLTRIEPGHYDMICLPIKLKGAEGAPARVVLRPRA